MKEARRTIPAAEKNGAGSNERAQAIFIPSKGFAKHTTYTIGKDHNK